MTDIAGERGRLAAQGLDITTREQWGARQDYTAARSVNRPARWLFLHVTVTADPADTLAAEAAACRQVEAIGLSRFGIGWSYNAGVMQSGRLYEGQPLTRRGAHTVNDKPNPNFPTGSLNYDARALALVQNVQDAVTDAQIDAAARWGAALRRSGEATINARWYGHRDVTTKSCPGDKGYARLRELNALTDRYTTFGLPGSPPPPVPRRRKKPMFAIRAANRPWAVCIPSQAKSFLYGDPAWVAQFIPQNSADEWRPDEEFYSLAKARAFEVEGDPAGGPGKTAAISVGDRDWDNCVQATREAAGV